LECEAEDEKSFAQKFCQAVNQAYEGCFTPLDVIENLEDCEVDIDELHRKRSVRTTNTIS
jgi:hypothetical protein